MKKREELLLYYVAEYPNILNESNKVISKYQKLVLDHLLYIGSKYDDGVFDILQKDILEKIGGSPALISNCMQRLEAFGFITVLERYRYIQGKGIKKSKYKINYDALKNYIIQDEVSDDDDEMTNMIDTINNRLSELELKMRIIKETTEINITNIEKIMELLYIYIRKNKQNN